MKLALILLTVASEAFSAEIAPRFNFLGTNDEASAISADCKFDDKTNRTITCSFDRRTLSYPKETTVEDMIKDLTENGKVSPKEVFNQIQLSICKSIPTLKAEKSERPLALKALEEYEALCNDTKLTKEGFVRAYAALNVKMSTVCTIRSHQFGLQFKRSGSYKWVSDSSPQGSCSVSSVTVLEAEDGNDYRWSYKFTRLAVGGNSDFCKVFNEEVGKTHVYSWKFADTFGVKGCSQITFAP